MHNELGFTWLTHTCYLVTCFTHAAHVMVSLFVCVMRSGFASGFAQSADATSCVCVRKHTPTTAALHQQLAWAKLRSTNITTMVVNTRVKSMARYSQLVRDLFFSKTTASSVRRDVSRMSSFWQAVVDAEGDWPCNKKYM